MNSIINTLSSEQKRALTFVLKSQNVFISGPGGSGKTHLINVIRKVFEAIPKNIAITSTTGISAINIGGITLHSWAGIGLATKSAEMLTKEINYRHKKVWKEIDVLIIDEISMLSCDTFDKLNYIAKNIRQSPDFFGGIQLVLFGDFYQLSPIDKQQKLFCFESDDWKYVKNTVILREVFRQSDLDFVGMLNRFREGKYTDGDIQTIISRKIPAKGVCVKLYPKNREINDENQKKLEELPGSLVEYSAIFEGKNYDLLSELKSQFEKNDLTKIKLKNNARVMLIVNVNPSLGLVNGLMGTIVDFIAGIPFVKFDNGKTSLIERYSWELEYRTNDKSSASRSKKSEKVRGTQIPLKLAYALSIHKIQGQTISSDVEISLGDCFAPHHIYVALSRVKNLENLYISTFSPDKIRIDSRVQKFYNSLGNINS